MKNHSFQKLTLISTFATVLFIACPLFADSDCFCYKHTESEAIMVGCKEYKQPNSTEIHCYNEEENQYSIFQPAIGWTRISGDAPDCDPCAPYERQQKKTGPDVIRGAG